MKKIFLALLLMLAPAWVMAAGVGVHLDKANIDPTNKQSLQRGARLFVNYCLSCHAAALMRYERIGADLGIDEKLRRGAINLAGAAHGNAAGFVLQLVVCFINDGLSGRFLLHVGSQAAALDHKAFDHTMKDRAVVMAGFGIGDEILDADRSLVAV